jgi:hypothetical protein
MQSTITYTYASVFEMPKLLVSAKILEFYTGNKDLSRKLKVLF